MNEAALAAHRFGLGETSLSVVQPDPRRWVLDQLRPPSPLDDAGLASTAEMRALGQRVLRAALQPTRAAAPGGPADLGLPVRTMPAGEPQAMRSDARLDARPGEAADLPSGDSDRRALRAAALREQQRRWQHGITTPTPVAERWIAFWANHFTVAATKGTTLGLVGPYEREAIRPHAFGRFADLLRAAILHPAMLLYLDNAVSFGAASPTGVRRGRGLNENLGRELLELHTLGVGGGYTQSDVTEAARVLTGWTVARLRPGGDPTDAAPQDAGTARFVPALHDPGSKRILGRRYEEGPQAIEALLADLARHPSTARHLATRLVRHFVADEPPPALVDAVAEGYLASDGDLAATARALFTHDLAWQPDGPGKFKRPEEWMLCAHRVLRWPIPGPGATAGLVTALTEMGQPPGRAPSPQGWPDLQADWLAPDALWKRIEWAARFAQTVGPAVDVRSVADASLGPSLSPGTRREIQRAESPAQALALWLVSPDFLRR